MTIALNGQQEGANAATSTFADRVRLLIQRVGSATEIARKCGFSEGVVRSWRDGHTDPSRGRCVTLAKTLGISLVWLVAGEGPIQAETQASNDGGEATTELMSRAERRQTSAVASFGGAAVDPQRLAAAMKILQSNLQLADSTLNVTDNTDLLAELYEVLGPGGISNDPESLVVFNQHLSERIRRTRPALS